MQLKFLITFLLIGQFLLGQTGKHIKISGTKCSLIPPDGFIAATNFSGFQNAETGASIMINEMPANFQQSRLVFQSVFYHQLNTKGRQTYISPL